MGFHNPKHQSGIKIAAFFNNNPSLTLRVRMKSTPRAPEVHATLIDGSPHNQHE